MSFMGRGERPAIDRDSIEDNDFSELYHDVPLFWGRYYYCYVPLDNTYVIMQMIVTFIILIVGAIAFLMSYKTNIVDPIESIKKIFINTHLIVLGVLLAITFVTNRFSKTESDLIRRLVLINAISIIAMLVFLGVKINLDSTYTENKFEEFYIEQNTNEITNKKSKLDIGISSMSIKTEKEYYVDECMNLYNIFKIKSYIILGLHLLLNILLIYQILRVQKIQNKKEKLDKDELILFDEEENIKC